MSYFLVLKILNSSNGLKTAGVGSVFFLRFLPECHAHACFVIAAGTRSMYSRLICTYLP